MLKTQNSMNRDEFILKSKIAHGDKYDYSKVEYKNNRTKVCIICPKHGEFWQTPTHHLSGHGCKKCATESLWKTKRKKVSFDDFKRRVEDKFGNIYDFSKSHFTDMHGYIEVGYNGKFFKTTPTKLLASKKPIKHNFVENKEDFVYKAKKIFSNKYDYSKVEYKDSHTKVCIICPKHGEFWQTPNEHLTGHQCHKCNNSKMQDKLKSLLNDFNIEYIEEYSPSFLNDKFSHQRYDFFIPKINTAIECQGRQHFMPYSVFGGEIALDECIERDIRKNIKTNENGIKILYLIDRHFSIENISTNAKYNGIYNRENCFKSNEKIVSKILKIYNEQNI